MGFSFEPGTSDCLNTAKDQNLNEYHDNWPVFYSKQIEHRRHHLRAPKSKGTPNRAEGIQMSSTTEQVMMTLAALAATGATERPSGESLEQQEQRILTGINSQLANNSLATAGQWSAIWVGLTASRANLAY